MKPFHATAKHPTPVADLPPPGMNSTNRSSVASATRIWLPAGSAGSGIFDVTPGSERLTPVTGSLASASHCERGNSSSDQECLQKGHSTRPASSTRSGLISARHSGQASSGMNRRLPTGKAGRDSEGNVKNWLPNHAEPGFDPALTALQYLLIAVNGPGRSADQTLFAQKVDRIGNGGDGAVDIGVGVGSGEHRPPTEEIDPAHEQGAAEGVRELRVDLAIEFLDRIAVGYEVVGIGARADVLGDDGHARKLAVRDPVHILLLEQLVKTGAKLLSHFVGDRARFSGGNNLEGGHSGRRRQRVPVVRSRVLHFLSPAVFDFEGAHQV